MWSSSPLFLSEEGKGRGDSLWYGPTHEPKLSRVLAVRGTILDVSYETVIILEVLSAAPYSQDNLFLWHHLTCTEPAKPYAIQKDLIQLLYVSCLTLPIWKFPYRKVFSVFFKQALFFRLGAMFLYNLHRDCIQRCLSESYFIGHCTDIP